MTKRAVMAAVAFSAAILLVPEGAVAQENKANAVTKHLIEIQNRLGARVGASILDTHTDKRWSYRADERFPLTSTFKVFACGGVLHRVDAGQEDLERRISFEKADLVSYSPLTEKCAGAEGMSLFELCQATMAMSDNTAGNLVLDSLGGPEGFTAFMRSIRDAETRLDRRETELNEAAPGDPRDTTTPEAAANSLHDLVLGDILSPTSRQQLEDWLAGNKVSGPLLRASLPEGWRIGDRTGAGGNGSRSIIAVIWPPKRKPVVAAIYLTGTTASMDERNQAIAEIGRVLIGALTD